MYIAIGKIVKTHGTQGFLKAVAYSENPERFQNLKVVYLEQEEGVRGYIVEAVETGRDFVLLKLRGINSREQAKKLVRMELLLPENQKINPPDDTYFIHDLIGLSVFDIHDNYLGKIVEVYQGAGNDVYEVRGERKKILIPAVSEFVKQVDLENKKVIVKLIEGMVEHED